MPADNPHGIKNGWYMFPVNYDPTWMIEQCKAFSEKVDENLVAKEDPLQTLFSLFAKRF